MKHQDQANEMQHQALLRLVKKGENFLTALVRNVLNREDIHIISEKVIWIKHPEETFCLLAMQAITTEGVTLGVELSFANPSKLELRKHRHITLSKKLSNEFGLDHEGEPYLISLIYALPEKEDQQKKRKCSLPQLCQSDDCYVMMVKGGETRDRGEPTDILKEILFCLREDEQTILSRDERVFLPERKSRLRLK